MIKLNQSADIKNNTIIYNGVNLRNLSHQKRVKRTSLLCVEGNIDYSPYAIELLNQLQDKLIDNSIYTSIVVYGNFENPENRNKLNSKIDYRGFISHNEIQNIYKNAVYLSLDINAACPNTVIEAMACGIPVIGFDTGALKELVSSDAGEVVPYGSNPWELKFPSVNNLITAANKVIENYETYSRNARKVAEEKFSIQQIGETYLKFLLKEL